MSNFPESHHGLLRAPKNPTMVQDEEGRNRLTHEYTVALCEFNGQYTTPKCNNKLFLHYKGFEKVENLEAYTKVKAIWLESNGLKQISGMDHMIGMRCLYLHQNKIERIENMLTFSKLCILNLSHNQIRVVEGLENCLELMTLDLSHNHIENITDCDQLKMLPKLAHLDLKANKINDKDNIVPFVQSLTQITSLYLLNNPCIRLLSGLRRQLVLACPTLYYLDDRPINEWERKRIIAFEEGGKEAEDKVRAEAESQYRANLRCGYERNKKIEDESRIERKKQFKRMMNEVQQEKESVTNELKNVRKMLKGMDSDTPEYRRLFDRQYRLEREVRQDWYQKLKKRDEDVPHVMGRSALQTSKEFIEDYDRRYQAEQESVKRAQSVGLNIAKLHAEEEKKEAEYRRQEQAQYARRQRGLAGEPENCVVPIAYSSDNNQQRDSNNSGNSSGGAVSGTDSESELDTKNRMVKDLTAVQWSPGLEARLEEILIRNAFDFKQTAREFQRFLNSPENPDEIQTLFFKIDAKTLQLKWTDIEIRKHVIPDMQNQQKKEVEASDESVEDDLPPLYNEDVPDLEDGPRTVELDDDQPPSPEQEKTMGSAAGTAARQTAVFNYGSDSSEEQDGRSGSTSASGSVAGVAAAASVPSKVQYSKYTDLEELD